MGRGRVEGWGNKPVSATPETTGDVVYPKLQTKGMAQHGSQGLSKRVVHLRHFSVECVTNSQRRTRDRNF